MALILNALSKISDMSLTDFISSACPQKLDLVFVIDGSICGGAESCPDWIYLLQFVKNLVASFNIGPDTTRVALITVSSEGKLEWNFDQ